jgi:hypothetical protein
MRRRRCRRWSSAGLGRADLVAYFLDSGPSHFVQDGDHVAMQGHHLRTDGDFDPGIAFMERIKTRQDLVIRNVDVIEENRVSRSDLNCHVIFYRLWRWRLSGRKGDFDTFHVRLAQAYHHETGEQEKHDVDQRDDLDPRSFFRDG